MSRRVWTALGAVLVVLVARESSADPLALRQPTPGRAIALAVGAPHTSIALQLDNGLAFAVSTRLPVSVVSADVAYRGVLGAVGAHWSFPFAVWTGVSVPTVQAALAIDLGASLHARARRGWFVAQLGVAVPATLRVTNGVALRAPVTLDVWIGAQVWRFSFGLQGGVGASFVTGASPGLVLAASVYGSISF